MLDQERAMCSGPKSKATVPSWVYDASAFSEARPWSAVWSGAKVWGARVRKSTSVTRTRSAGAALKEPPTLQNGTLRPEFGFQSRACR
jgi:hypothetical protein